MRLEPYLHPDRTVILAGCAGLSDLLRELAVLADGDIPGVTVEKLVDSLVERERRHPTSTPEGVAFPHAMLPEIRETRVVAAIVRGGVDFGVRGHPPCDLVFGMFGDANEPFSHVRLLARLARIAHAPGALERLRGVKTAQAFHSTLVAEDRAHG